MKRSFNLFGLTAALLFIFNALFAQTTPGDNPLFHHLPPGAAKVYRINLSSLVSKVGPDAIAALRQASSGDIKTLLTNPEQSGVDLQSDIFIADEDKKDKDHPKYTTVVVHLTDSGKFIKFVRTVFTGVHIYHLPGKGRSAGKEKIGIAWDNQTAIFTILPKSASTNPAAPEESTLLAAKKSLVALHGFENVHFPQEPLFSAGMSSDDDFTMWGKQTAAMSSLRDLLAKKMPPSAMEAFTKSMNKQSGNFLLGVRFDAGRILLHSKSSLNPDTAAFYAAVLDRPFNASLLAQIPGGPLLGAFSITFDFAGLNGYLEKLGMRKKLDSMLASKNITSDDIFQSLKGDFLIAATAPVPAGDSTPARKMPNVFFATTIGNPISFLKVVHALNLLPDPHDSTGNSGILSKLKADYTLKNNILVVAPNKQLSDGYFSNTSLRSTDLIDAEARKSPFIIALDVKAIAAYLRQTQPNPSAKDQGMLHIMDMFDKVTLSVGAMHDNTAECALDLRLTDQSTNSLKTLFSLIPGSK